MAELDKYRRVLRPRLRAVWPLLAEAVRDIDGYLVGGTALTTYLQHRSSFDLDYMAHQSFSGTDLAEALNSAATHATFSRAEPDRMHAVIDGVAVDVFVAPTRGEHPGHVQQLAPPAVIDGLRVASLADLLAMKLDVIMYRPNLRDYMDIAAIDNSGGLRLEDGVLLHMRRYGTHLQSAFLDRIVDRLQDPGPLAADPEFAAHAERVLGYLAGRVTDLRSHLQRLRRGIHRAVAPTPLSEPLGLLREPLSPPEPGPATAEAQREAKRTDGGADHPTQI